MILLVCKDYGYKPDEFYELPVNKAYGVIYSHFQIRDSEEAQYKEMMNKRRPRGR